MNTDFNRCFVVDKRREAIQNMRLNDEIERLKTMTVRAILVAFLAFCAAAVLLMLLVRSHYSSSTAQLYCVHDDGGWRCDYDLSRLRSEPRTDSLPDPTPTETPSTVGVESILKKSHMIWPSPSREKAEAHV
jgi:hypothetical protein